MLICILEAITVLCLHNLLLAHVQFSLMTIIIAIDCYIWTITLYITQAVRHSAKAVQFSDPSSRAEAYHTHGTILKDIGRLSEAEKVCTINL